MSDGNDIYWDLYELNPDAVIYVEYEDAYVGYTSNAKGFWVAVYDNGAITEAITAGLGPFKKTGFKRSKNSNRLHG